MSENENIVSFLTVSEKKQINIFWLIFSMKMSAILQILKDEREVSDINIVRLKSAYDFRKKYLINQNKDLFLTVDSVISLNNIITGSQNTHLRSCEIKPTGFNKRYMHSNKIELVLYGLVDDFNDRRITHRKFALDFLDKIHPFADGNSRTCKILFVDKIEMFF